MIGVGAGLSYIWRSIARHTVTACHWPFSGTVHDARHGMTHASDAAAQCTCQWHQWHNHHGLCTERSHWIFDISYSTFINSSLCWPWWWHYNTVEKLILLTSHVNLLVSRYYFEECIVCTKKSFGKQMLFFCRIAGYIVRTKDLRKDSNRTILYRISSCSVSVAQLQQSLKC